MSRIKQYQLKEYKPKSFYLYSRVTQTESQDGIPEKNYAALQDTDHCNGSNHRHHSGSNAPAHAGVLVCSCLFDGGSLACSHHHVAKVPN